VSFQSVSPSKLITDPNELQGESLRRGLIPRDFTEQPFGSLGFAAPFDMPIIPRSEWAGRIEERTRKKMRITDLVEYYKVPPQHQGQTNYCWINCVVRCIEMSRLIAGSPHVPLSPASCGGPITGFRDVGGWPERGVEYAAAHGAVPSSLWPANAIDRRYDTPTNNAEREKYQIKEWTELRPKNFEQLATLLLHGIPVATAHMWMKHAVTAVDLLSLGNGKFAVLFHNSGHKRDRNGLTVLDERLATPDSGIAPRVATAT